MSNIENGDNGDGSMDLNLSLGIRPSTPTGRQPFPWATEGPAGMHTLDSLLVRGIRSVEGDVACHSCGRGDRAAYDLQSKFEEVAEFLVAEGEQLHDRAPARWMNPAYSDCGACGRAGCVRPVVAEREEDINWLFLFLGQALGICKLEQLKWYCKNVKCHQTGAKNRLLYLSYLAICKQLQPGNRFDGLGRVGGMGRRRPIRVGGLGRRRQQRFGRSRYY